MFKKTSLKKKKRSQINKLSVFFTIHYNLGIKMPDFIFFANKRS